MRAAIRFALGFLDGEVGNRTMDPNPLRYEVTNPHPAFPFRAGSYWFHRMDAPLLQPPVAALLVNLRTTRVLGEPGREKRETESAGAMV
jgi:hypothetical protein